MKFLLVIDGFGSGGAQRQMVNLAAGLTRRGHTVEFAIYHPEMRHLAPTVEALDVPVHAIKRNPLFPFSVALGIRRLIKLNRYECVLAFLETPSLYSEIACLGLHRTKLVVSERTAIPPEGRSLTLRIIYTTHRLADWVTVNSHHHRRDMMRVYPWMNEKSSVIYNGVDSSLFVPVHQGEPGTSPNLRLLSIGTIIPRKNASGLVRALAVYREHFGEPPHVTWVGKKENTDRSRRAFAEASALLKDLDLEHAWTWLGERTDMVDLYNAHDALIHPSMLEGLPNVICEAMACARPVLAGNVCDHAILVEDGTRGFLFDPYKPEDIADKMHQFKLLTPSQRARLGQHGLEYARRELSMDAYVEAYLQLFRDLLDHS